MEFSFTTLGTSAAIPAFGRSLSAHIVQYDQQPYLIDCGEGTQFQMQKYLVASAKINQIFISHLHGDHYFGLFGLITSYGLTGRSTPLEIYAPQGLGQILKTVVMTTEDALPYPLILHEIDTTKFQVICEDAHLTVYSIPLLHRIPCSGFLFQEKKKTAKYNSRIDCSVRTVIR